MNPTYLADINKENFDFSHGSRLVDGCSGLVGVWGRPIMTNQWIDCYMVLKTALCL